MGGHLRFNSFAKPGHTKAGPSLPLDGEAVLRYSGLLNWVEPSDEHPNRHTAHRAIHVGISKDASWAREFPTRMI
jgi:hypothetical protein